MMSIKPNKLYLPVGKGMIILLYIEGSLDVLNPQSRDQRLQDDTMCKYNDHTAELQIHACYAPRAQQSK